LCVAGPVAELCDPACRHAFLMLLSHCYAGVTAKCVCCADEKAGAVLDSIIVTKDARETKRRECRYVPELR
jgi:hypothetical protein